MFEHKAMRTSWRQTGAFIALLSGATLSSAAVRVEGRVVDANGQPVAQAQVIFQRAPRPKTVSRPTAAR
jgi:protocatechuate 3,4-dioxygenase beta subunit